MTGAPGLDVVVTVGSDHHRFDRLVHWVDRWAESHPEHRVWCQYGPADPPRSASGVAWSRHDELLDRIASADCVVTSTGPGTVMEIRAAGLRPVVVPRRAALGECVDDHQVAFAHKLHQEGTGVSCETEDELVGVLDRVAADPWSLRLADAERTAEPPARERVASLLDGLLQTGRR